MAVPAAAPLTGSLTKIAVFGGLCPEAASNWPGMKSIRSPKPLDRLNEIQWIILSCKLNTWPRVYIYILA
jgi:hypothetical protein